MFPYGMEPCLLLLRRGDLSAARSGFSKVLNVHRRILDRVRQGVATAEVYALEAIMCNGYLPYALVCSGQLDELREFLAHSLTGALPFDESIRVGVATYWGEGELGAWVSEDGHRSNTLDTLLLFARGLTALVEEDDDASRAALAEWLPPATRLLHIAEYECEWRLDTSGSCHPALLLARLHGERLSHWALAAEVAEGVLRIEEFNPILRTEACHITHTTDTPFSVHAPVWCGGDRVYTSPAHPSWRHPSYYLRRHSASWGARRRRFAGAQPRARRRRVPPLRRQGRGTSGSRCSACAICCAGRMKLAPRASRRGCVACCTSCRLRRRSWSQLCMRV